MKVTMQNIADALGVSRVTVWKVFNNQESVSETLRAQIMQKAAQMGYMRAMPEITYAPPPPARQTVSVIVSRPESSIFWMNIIHRLAKELTKSAVNLMYTYVPSAISPGYALPSVLTDGSIQGAVVLNVYDSQLVHLVNQLNMPKIFLDTTADIPTSQLHGDLVLLEGSHATCTMTEDLIKKGRTKIGFIGDVAYARTNKERYNGFLAALAAHGVRHDPSCCLTGPLDIYSYSEAIGNFLGHLKAMPEAFVCVSDYVADFVYRHLTGMNCSIPGDVALTGFDGSTEYTSVAGLLTTAQVDTPALGKRLAHQMLYRLRSPGAPWELVYIRPQVIYGDSTDF